jgi:hypothetical protein
MIQNKRDKELTKLARRAGLMHHPSYISYAGHWYLIGKDKGLLRDRVMADAKNICAVCGQYCSEFDGNMHHLASGSRVRRCDCYHTMLVDGTEHTNVVWICGMFAPRDCHRKAHNREVQWSK